LHHLPALPHIQPWEQWWGEQVQRRRARTGFLAALSGAATLPVLAVVAHVAPTSDRAHAFFAVTALAAVAAIVWGLVELRLAASRANAHSVGATSRAALVICVASALAAVGVALATDGIAATVATLMLPTIGVAGHAIILRAGACSSRRG